MSEITRGVIGMPFKLAMGSEMSRRQFHACAQEVFVENERLELENEDTLKKFEEVVEGFTKLSAEVLDLRQQLAIPSDVLADCEALRLENEALRKDADKWQIVERTMLQLQSDEQQSSIWSLCARLLITVAHQINAGTSTVTEEGVTIDGEEVGDWRVTVERIRPPSMTNGE